MSFKTALHQMVAALEQAGAAYVVGGSMASAHHGIPRATNDIDILVDLQLSHLPTLLTTLRPEFYLDDQEAMECIRLRRSFNLIHMATVYKFDLFLASTPFHFAQLDRAVPATFDFMGAEITCRMSSAEDIVLAKLDWYRIGGCSSERQMNDITNVLAVSGKRLDRDYLDHWAQKLGLSELLEKAINESQI